MLIMTLKGFLQQVKDWRDPVWDRDFSHYAELFKHSDKPACLFAFGFSESSSAGWPVCRVGKPCRDQVYLPSPPPLQQTRGSTGGALESKHSYTRKLKCISTFFFFQSFESICIVFAFSPLITIWITKLRVPASTIHYWSTYISLKVV